MRRNDEFHIFGRNIYIIQKYGLVLGPRASADDAKGISFKFFRKFQGIVHFNLVRNPIKARIATHGCIAETNTFLKHFGIFILHKKMIESSKRLSHKTSVNFEENLLFPENAGN